MEWGEQEFFDPSGRFLSLPAPPSDDNGLPSGKG